MKRVLLFSAIFVMLFVISGIAQAVTYNYTVTPNDLASASTFINGQGGVMFGYDEDPNKSGIPIGSTTGGGATGYGDSAFYSDVQGSAAGGVGDRDYTAFRMSPKDIFGVTDVTIGDLSSLSYYTKWESGIDWQVKIYTEPITTGWYGHRINFVRPTPGDSNWNQYSSDSLLVDWVYGSGVNNNTDTSFANVKSIYGSDTIMFIDVIASYATNSPPSYSYLDGVQMTLATGDIAKMDLSVVPEPISSTLFLVGAATLGFRRFRKANKV